MREKSWTLYVKTSLNIKVIEVLESFGEAALSLLAVRSLKNLSTHL